MSARQQPGEGGQTPGDAHQPVTGGSPRADRAGRHRRDGHSALASRRDAVLRVLMEAYRRDVGPTALDPR